MFAIVQGTARRVRLNVTNSLGYFLIKFTNQYNLDEVLAVFQNVGSVLKPIILITDSDGYGTPNPLDGEVNLNVVGNWEAKIYSQSSSTNLNVDLATNLLSTTTVFVQGDSTCVVNTRNTPLIRTCQDVKDCIGISSTGDSTKYLNEVGDWVVVSSGGGSGTSLTDTITAGENLVENDLVYLESDGKYWKADNETIDTCITELRLVTDATILADATGESLSIGLKDGFTGLTAGSLYYVGTDGAISLYADIPDIEDNVSRIIGTAKSTTELEFKPDTTYIVNTLSPNNQSGILRIVENRAGVTATLGSTALTDYVENCTGTNTLTLPTAVGNTNKYTVTVISGSTTINTTSSQTINGSSSIVMTTAYLSLDFISNGSNWLIR